jgi:glycosyltransferase involved in cell wall biosynthesis
MMDCRYSKKCLYLNDAGNKTDSCDICPFYSNTIKVIYLGGYQKNRGIEELLASTTFFDKKIQLYFQGNGLEKYGRTSNVKIVPTVPPNMVVESLRDYDIGIVPYKPSSLNNMLATPNKLFEYMMAGLAVAASDLPEIKKIIVYDRVGELFDPEDPRDIARCINHMALDLKRLQTMKCNALRAAHDKYNW